MMRVASFLDRHLGLLEARQLSIGYSEKEKMKGDRNRSGGSGVE